ncbi:MAG: hypothetical protein RIS76_639, partial [Verrucomicrobiota bacterium]
MRQRRLKAPVSFPIAHYHCMSRVVNRDFVFGPQGHQQGGHQQGQDIHP